MIWVTKVTWVTRVTWVSKVTWVTRVKEGRVSFPSGFLLLILRKVIVRLC